MFSWNTAFLFGSDGLDVAGHRRHRRKIAEVKRLIGRCVVLALQEVRGGETEVAQFSHYIIACQVFATCYAHGRAGGTAFVLSPDLCSRFDRIYMDVIVRGRIPVCVAALMTALRWTSSMNVARPHAQVGAPGADAAGRVHHDRDWRHEGCCTRRGPTSGGDGPSSFRPGAPIASQTSCAILLSSLLPGTRGGSTETDGFPCFHGLIGLSAVAPAIVRSIFDEGLPSDHAPLEVTLSAPRARKGARIPPTWVVARPCFWSGSASCTPTRVGRTCLCLRRLLRGRR